MLRWVPYALVRVVLFYILGILVAMYHPYLLGQNMAFIIALTLSCIYVCLWLFGRKFFLKINVLIAFFGLMAIATLGYYNVLVQTERFDEHHLLNHADIEAYTAQVMEPAHETAKAQRYLVEVNKVLKQDQWTKASGKVYLYLSKKDSTTLQYGDEIAINGSPKVLTAPQNPGEFDYKRFLSFQNIYHNQFVSTGNLSVLSHNNGNKVMNIALEARQWASQTLGNGFDSEREKNIALALVLGVKDGLDNEIKNAYSASGAMHVLAVSGLHVGIIYLIVSFIFGRLQKVKVGRWLLAALSIFVLISYAAITGFSPSVLRAATMFSAMALAKAFDRSTNIYNTLSGSAFLLLTYNPYLIMSVGFQLSFLAVLGIVYLQPKIYALFVSRNWLIDKVWAITAVSIAAQLATFSLGLLYFHQFPTFFFLSNLVVIPGAFAILIGGLLIMAVSFFEPLYKLITTIVEFIIYIINELVFSIQVIPNSQINDIYITTPQTWLIMGFILAIFLFFQLKRLSYFYFSAMCILIFSIVQWQNTLANTNTNKLTIYRINQQTALDFVQAGQSKLYADAELLADEEKLRFHIRPNHLINGVKIKNQVPLHEADSVFDGIKLIQKAKKKVLILNKKWEMQLITDQPIEVDFLIISKGFYGSLNHLKKHIKFKTLILDASISNFLNEKLKNEATELNFYYHSLLDDGAFEVFI